MSEGPTNDERQPGGSLSAIDKASFKRELTDVVPHLRAFARGLCGRPDLADDLVQETLLKAWAAQDRFEPGTSMRAWTFVILRNAYLTDMRRNRFRGEYDEGVAERILTAPAGQEEPIHLSDARRCCWSAQAGSPTRKPRKSAAVRSARSRAAWAAPALRSPKCWRMAASRAVRAMMTWRTARSLRSWTRSRPAMG
jgi:RNA polymerase sigma factor (sigma-70 family)